MPIPACPPACPPLCSPVLLYQAVWKGERRRTGGRDQAGIARCVFLHATAPLRSSPPRTPRPRSRRLPACPHLLPLERTSLSRPGILFCRSTLPVLRKPAAQRDALDRAALKMGLIFLRQAGRAAAAAAAAAAAPLPLLLLRLLLLQR